MVHCCEKYDVPRRDTIELVVRLICSAQLSHDLIFTSQHTTTHQHKHDHKHYHNHIRSREQKQEQLKCQYPTSSCLSSPLLSFFLPLRCTPTAGHCKELQRTEWRELIWTEWSIVKQSDCTDRRAVSYCTALSPLIFPNSTPVTRPVLP
jgi:hypothetical protein